MSFLSHLTLQNNAKCVFEKLISIEIEFKNFFILKNYYIKWGKEDWNLGSLIIKEIKPMLIGQECIDPLWWINQLMHKSKYVTNQLMHGSKYVTNHQLEKDVGCKVLIFINKMKITKLVGYKTLWRTNAAASWRERWTRENCLRSQYTCDKPLHQVALTCIFCDGP